jgi:4'-phosphopantetheinyl transferase
MEMGFEVKTIRQKFFEPLEGLRLGGGDVDVWEASLRQPADWIEGFRQTLSGDELRRADAFHFQRHREAFIVGRGLLRSLLGGYLGVPPQELLFSYTEFGKPSLSESSRAGSLRFNFSSSHEMALCAFTLNREVGVDIEHRRAEVECEQLAERFFSAPENESLQKLPRQLRPRAFFDCWTRKEAFIKAVGEGLSFPLDQFDVSLAPGETAALLTVRGDAGEAARWSVVDLPAPPGYAAALAVEGHGWHLRRWRWAV